MKKSKCQGHYFKAFLFLCLMNLYSAQSFAQQSTSIQNVTFSATNQSIFSPGDATSIHKRYNLFADNGINSSFFVSPTVDGVACFNSTGTDVINTAIDAVNTQIDIINVAADPNLPHVDKQGSYCFGAKFDLKLGFDFDAYADITIQGGAANVTYPAKFTFKYPANNTFGCGDDIWITTKAEIGTGYNLAVTDPAFEFKLGTKVKGGIYVGGQACFFGCTNQGSAIDYGNPSFSGANSSNYISLLKGGDYDMFKISSATGISFPWNLYSVIPAPPGIPTLELPLTTSLIPNFEDKTHITGELANPFLNLDVADGISGTSLINHSTSDFFNIQFDPIQYTELLTGIPLSISADFGAGLSASFTSISAPVVLDVNQDNNFRLNPTLLVDLNLGRVLHWQECIIIPGTFFSPPDTVVIRSGNSQNVSGFTMGNFLRIKSYPDKTASNVIPSFNINAGFASTFKEQFNLGIDIKIAEGSFNFPAFDLSGICSDMMDRLGIHDQVLRDIFEAACSGLNSISSNGGIQFGPYPQPTPHIDLANWEIPVMDNNFSMGGFNNNIPGTAFSLQPDNIAPVLVTKNITRDLVNGNSLTIIPQDIIQSAVDNEGGTIEYLSLSKNMFDCSNIGQTISVVITIGDGRCNTTTGTANVTITDNTGPTAQCKHGAVTLYLQNPNSTATLIASQIDSGTIGSCISLKSLSLVNVDCSKVGNQAVVMTVTDNSGRISRCTTTVVVRDTIRPIAICQPSVTVYLDTLGKVTLKPSDLNNGSSDACGILSMTVTNNVLANNNFTCSQISTPITATLRVTDNNNNFKTCTSSVSVQDNLSGTITCPPNVFITACGPTQVFYNQPTIRDNCSLTPTYVRTVSPNPIASGGLFPLGGTLMTFEAFDASANSTGTCNFQVFITQQPLTITCPANITVNTLPNQCRRVVGYTPPSSGSCPGTITQIAGNSSGSEFNIGSTNNTFQIVDASSRIATCTFSVIVVDTQKPVITCPSNITVNSTSPTCDAVVTYSLPTGSDNCFTPGITRIAGLASGSTFPSGTTINTYQATDFGGNIKTCSFNIVVVAPSGAVNISCPPNIAVNTAPNSCQTIVNYSTPIGTASCELPTTIQTAGLASGVSYPKGVTTNSFKTTNAGGNMATCSFTVTVSDTQKPVITCPSNITVNTSSPTCDAIVTYALPSGSDNCLSPSITLLSGLASGSTFPLGITINTYKATDASGNIKTCFFNVTVVGSSSNLNIVCPANIAVNTAPNSCDAVVNYTTPIGPASCEILSTIQTAGLASGALFPIGLTTNTFKTTNSAGNMSTCSFTVTVSDSQKPGMICPVSLIVNTSSPTCDVVVDYSLPIALDNCGSTSMIQIAGLASGSAFPPGITTNTYQATDASGNTNTCSFNIRVPFSVVTFGITCPSNMVINTAPNSCSAIVNFIAPIGTAPCEVPTTIQTTGLISGSSFPTGITSNTFVTTKSSGEIATCSFTVTVVDTQMPVIVCPANVVLMNDPNTCGAIYNYTKPLGTDNCAGLSGFQKSGKGPGSLFPVGITNNVFESTDASGNVTSCSFTVRVTDTQAPVIICPSNIIVNNDPNTCGAVVNYTAPLASDNCALNASFIIEGLASGSTFPIGTTNVRYLARDNQDKKSDCSFTVTVIDTQKPIIVCPPNTVLMNDPNVCGAVFNYTKPLGTDNCPGLSGFQKAGKGPGSLFPVGITNNVFESTDASGNVSSCSFTVRVTDTQAPVIICPSNIIVNNDPNTCGAIVNYTTPLASDNCALNASFIIEGFASGSTFPVGTTKVRYLARDNQDKKSDCSFMVTVVDTQKPVIICPLNVILMNNPNVCGAVFNYTKPLGTDNCPGLTGFQKSGIGPGAVFPIGITTNVFESTDASGNKANCSFTVTVRDTQKPVIVCPATQTINLDGNCQMTMPFYGNLLTLTDNCIPMTITQSPLAGSLIYGKGSLTISLTATDPSSNVKTCSFKVNKIGSNPVVADIIGLDTLCEGNTAIYTNTTAGGTWSRINGTGSASISDAGVVTAKSQGTVTINYTVTNECGTTKISKLIRIIGSPEVSKITGPANICVGDSASYSNITESGVWSVQNGTGQATITSGGVLIGISNGTVNVKYTKTNLKGCETNVIKEIKINAIPLVAVISGPDSVCIGKSVLFKNDSAGGTWSKINGTGNAKITDEGLFTSMDTGMVTIKYSITNNTGCKTVVVKKIKINGLPKLTAVQGPDKVCIGDSILLTMNVPGGTWSLQDSVNNSTGKAKISASGFLTGISTGYILVNYTLSNYCDTLVKSKQIKVKTIKNCGDEESFEIEEILTFNDDPTSSVITAVNDKHISMGDQITIQVYPVPSDHEFTLKILSTFKGLSDIRIFDIYGRQVQEAKHDPGHPFRFGEAFPEGIYWVTVKQGLQQVSTKIIKL